MYSVVLMTALTAGAGAPACHWGHGCYTSSGCYGCASCYGCYGIGWGSWGCYGGYGLGDHGGWGGYGSCYGGCYGGGYGGCSGCYGGYGCAGYAPAPYVVPTAPAAPASEPVPAPRPKETTDAISRSAKLVVDVPADAKLYVDDRLMKTTSDHRVFNTPALDRGQAYYYELRAEVVRDGEKRTATRRVIVRAGQEVRASFPDLDRLATVKNEVE